MIPYISRRQSSGYVNFRRQKSESRLFYENFSSGYGTDRRFLLQSDKKIHRTPHDRYGFRRSDAGNGHRYGKCGRNHSRGPPSPDEARRSHYRSSAASQNRGLYSGEQKQFRPGRHRHRCMRCKKIYRRKSGKRPLQRPAFLLSALIPWPEQNFPVSLSRWPICLSTPVI